MADTITGSLAESLPTMIQSARLFEEYEMTIPKTVDGQKLGNNQGVAWNEIRVEQLTAQGITETTVMDNAQQYADTLFSVTPTMTQIMTRVTDRTMRRISSNVAAQLGRAAQLAMNRKKDTDGIAQFANASVSLAGTGTTLTHGHVSAAVNRILGNTTESGAGAGAIHAVFHPFGSKDLEDEGTSGIGTYIVGRGMTEEFYRKGFVGGVAGANVWFDGNITVTATPSARGAVYAQKALVLVEGAALKSESRRRPDVGGGADEVFITDERAYGERRDAWIFSVQHDATVPVN